MRAPWWCPIGGGVVVAVVLACSPGTAAAQSCLMELDGVAGTVRFDGLAPGDTRAWSTSVRNVSGEPVDLSVALSPDGPLRSALVLDIDECSTPWVGSAGGEIDCSAAASTVHEDVDLGATPPATELGRLAPQEAWHGRFTVAMRASAGDEHQGAAGSLAATYTATGDATVCTEPPPGDPDPPVTTTVPPGSGPDDGGAPGPAGPTGPRGPRGPRGPSGSPEEATPHRRGPLAWTGADLTGTGTVAIALLAVGTVLRRRRDPETDGPTS